MKILEYEVVKKIENSMGYSKSVPFWHRDPVRITNRQISFGEIIEDAPPTSLKFPTIMPLITKISFQNSTKCVACYGIFDIFNRRHHCRQCGNSVCINCHVLSKHVLLGYIDYVRLCCDCLFLKQEDEIDLWLNLGTPDGIDIAYYLAKGNIKNKLITQGNKFFNGFNYETALKCFVLGKLHLTLWKPYIYHLVQQREERWLMNYISVIKQNFNLSQSFKTFFEKKVQVNSIPNKTSTFSVVTNIIGNSATNLGQELLLINKVAKLPLQPHNNSAPIKKNKIIKTDISRARKTQMQKKIRGEENSSLLNQNVLDLKNTKKLCDNHKYTEKMTNRRFIQDNQLSIIKLSGIASPTMHKLETIKEIDVKCEDVNDANVTYENINCLNLGYPNIICKNVACVNVDCENVDRKIKHVGAYTNGNTSLEHAKPLLQCPPIIIITKATED
jgi:hypothetical protein